MIDIGITVTWTPRPDLADFAVNVRGSAPPAWLRDRLVAAFDRLGTYPSAADDLRRGRRSPRGTAGRPTRCWC